MVHFHNSGVGNSVDTTSELFDPYTTDELKANTVAALPAYRGTYGDDPSAFRDYPSDETSYSIRRFKYKVRHYPSASCYMKIWLRFRFRPKGTTGASDIVSDGGNYEWFGPSGKPCLTDPSQPVDGNEIDSDASGEIGEDNIVAIAGRPDAQGTLSIEITKWSCLQGYEPDDPVGPSYLDRPDPDPNPNGWPTVHA